MTTMIGLWVLLGVSSLYPAAFHHRQDDLIWLFLLSLIVDLIHISVWRGRRRA